MNTLATRSLAVVAAIVLSAASFGAIVTVPPSTVTVTTAPLVA